MVLYECTENHLLAFNILLLATYFLLTLTHVGKVTFFKGKNNKINYIKLSYLCYSSFSFTTFTKNPRSRWKLHIDKRVCPAHGCRQAYGFCTENRRFYCIYKEISRNMSTSSHAQHTTVHVQHEKLLDKIWQMGVRDGS